MKPRLVTPFLIPAFFIIVFSFLSKVEAQPTLHFKSIAVDWPTVELNFNVFCGDQLVPKLDSAAVWLTEDNALVGNYSLWCSDTSTIGAMSVSLVFDASESMVGKEQSAQQAGLAFVNGMNGKDDEASIIWFNDTIALQQTMTSNKAALINALQPLPATGATAMLDAVYTCVLDARFADAKSYKAVIVLTGGDDTASEHSRYDIHDIVQGSGVRIYTVGLGSHVDASTLEYIARSGNGKFYQASQIDQLAQIYLDIQQDIRRPMRECKITYQASCADGSERSVLLSLINVCGDYDCKIRTYSAPRDMTTFAPIVISLPDTFTTSDGEIDVPLQFHMDFPTGNDQLSANFVVIISSAHLEFLGLIDKQGAMISSSQYDVVQSGDSIFLSFQNAYLMTDSGALTYLQFKARPGSVLQTSPLLLADVAFSRGCLKATSVNGSLHILEQATPHIEISGSTILCGADSTILRTTQPYTKYLWSTGETSRQITVRQSGKYSVTVVDSVGQHLIAPEVEIGKVSDPEVKIYSWGQHFLCEGSGRDIEIYVSGNFASYRWSNGDTTHAIRVKQPGTYYCVVKSVYGCEGVSDSITIFRTTLPSVTIAGDTVVCANTVVTYVATPLPHVVYTWDMENGVLLDPQGGNTMRVMWASYLPRTDFLTVYSRDTLTKCWTPNGISVEITPTQKPIVMAEGGTSLCEGDSTLLDAGSGFLEYTWSNGETGENLLVRQPGRYWVAAKNENGCIVLSDTIDIVAGGLPAPPIAGPLRVCHNSSVMYSIPNVSGYSCEWTVIGGDIVQGHSGPFIEVRWSNDTAGYVSVIQRDALCYAMGSLAIVIGDTLRPVISGPNNVCPDDIITLDAGSGYDEYRWSTGQRSRYLYISSPGTYTVHAQMLDGCSGTSDPFEVVQYPAPPTPAITRSGHILTSSSANAYQWYYNGAPVYGATGQNYITSAEGVYSVTITDENGCTATSEPYVLGIETPNANAAGLNVYPNPFKDQVEISAAIASAGRIVITVHDALGKERQRIEEFVPAGTYLRNLSGSALEPGVYFVRMLTSDRMETRRLLKQ